MKTVTKILPTREFNQGTTTATPDICQRMAVIQGEFEAHGVNLKELSSLAKNTASGGAEDALACLHEAATLLFLQWKRVALLGEESQTLAIARLFNGLTYQARDLNVSYNLVEGDHLDELAQALKADQRWEDFDPINLAGSLERAAKVHTHERAWIWVILPTFPRQPYGRILLMTVRPDGMPNPILVTQPFFLEGETTLCHTHGQNWAMSCPLGNGEHSNTHVNTLWMPRRPVNPFPLSRIDYVTYGSDDIVIIPPRVIHAISRKSAKNSSVPPSIGEILTDPALKRDLLAKTRFGERACLHMYRPCLPLSKMLADSPITKADSRFLIENDMIVFDHCSETIWSGAGGSWAQRMIEFGKTGEHCGICFEDDPRRENLDPLWVSESLIADPPPQLIRYRRQSP